MSTSNIIFYHWKIFRNSAKIQQQETSVDALNNDLCYPFSTVYFEDNDYQSIVHLFHRLGFIFQRCCWQNFSHNVHKFPIILYWMSLEHYNINHQYVNRWKLIRKLNAPSLYIHLLIHFLNRAQNRKPKFDAIHFEESVKPYAEDLTLENQYEKCICLSSIICF